MDLFFVDSEKKVLVGEFDDYQIYKTPNGFYAAYKDGRIINRGFVTYKDCVRDLPLSFMPTQINVDLSGRCNLKCTCCPYPSKLQEFKCDMDIEVYDKVLTDLREFKLVKDHYFSLHMFGEPTLHKNFISAVERASDFGYNVNLFTNCTGLTPSVSLQIAAYIKRIVFSLRTIRTKYTKLTGVKGYRKVRDNILAACYNFAGLPISIAFQFLKTTGNPIEDSNDLDGFYREWFNTVKWLREEQDEAHQPYFEVWGMSSQGGTTGHYDDIGDACDFPMSNLVVHVNGDVSFCCSKQEHYPVLGNIKEGSLYNIWFSDYAERIRSDFINKGARETDGCRSCVRECGDPNTKLLEPRMNYLLSRYLEE